MFFCLAKMLHVRNLVKTGGQPTQAMITNIKIEIDTYKIE